MRTTIACLTILLFACAQVGPRTIDRDRFDYGTSIAESGKEQMLLNILRLRYMEVPQFLEVTSVISQYTLEGVVNVGGTFVPNGTDLANLSGQARWSDRPTITYAPLSGHALTQRIMKPIEPSAVLFLIQSGWPVEFLFPLTVRSANGLQNVSGLMTFKGSGEAGYFRVVQILAELQRQGTVGMRLEKRGEDESAVMFVRKAGSEDGAELLRELRSVLDLDPSAVEYQLVYGGIPRSKTEITLLTKSAMEIMIELSRWAEVPEEHVAAKRTVPTRVETEIGGFRIDAPLRIHTGSRVPSSAFATVRYRGTDFWIEDGDFRSKRTFAFLQLLFSLVETRTQQLAPVVTVGAGG